jgi:ornithine--oxo-acid transaminase
MKALIEQQFESAAGLNKRYVHPKLAKMFALAGMKALFDRGEGQYLWSGERRFLDFLSGGGIHYIGRNHPAVRQAITDVAGMDLPNITIVNPSLLGGLLAQRLIALAGDHYAKCFFGNSGTEAADLAMRFARYATRRRRFLYLEGSFHGRTFAAISACGFPELREGQEPMMPTCTAVRRNDIAQLRRELSYGDVAGFIFEPVQGMTCEVLDSAYLREAEALCQQSGTLLIADEVQTGLGRCGSWFATSGLGMRPSLLMVSKTLSGGMMPVSAVLISDDVYERVFDKFKAGPFYWSTFAENNLAMAAGIATLDVLEQMNAPERSIELSNLIEEGVRRLADKYDCIERLAGQGLMRAIYFKTTSNPKLRAEQAVLDSTDKSAFAAALHVDMYREFGIMLQIPGPGLNAVKFLPPICTTEEDIRFFLDALDQTLARYYSGVGPVIGIGQTALKATIESGMESASARASAVLGLFGFGAAAAEHNKE